MNVVIDGLTKQYEQFKLQHISFSFDDEIVSVLGPSGSGKSTLLRCLCGLSQKDSGTIMFDGKKIDEIIAYEHQVCVVFGEQSLLDHLNVFDNISLGLRYRGYTNEEIDQRVHQITQDVEMETMLKRMPKTLSAGQRQRVVLARALVRDCRLLLLDEALNGLDVILRKKLIELLQKLQRNYRFSCLYVTHDPKEVLWLGGRVMILQEGQIQQLDTVENCRQNPANELVSLFLES